MLSSIAYRKSKEQLTFFFTVIHDMQRQHYETPLRVFLFLKTGSPKSLDWPLAFFFLDTKYSQFTQITKNIS